MHIILFLYADQSWQICIIYGDDLVLVFLYIVTFWLFDYKLVDLRVPTMFSIIINDV